MCLVSWRIHFLRCQSGIDRLTFHTGADDAAMVNYWFLLCVSFQGTLIPAFQNGFH